MRYLYINVLDRTVNVNAKNAFNKATMISLFIILH